MTVLNFEGAVDTLAVTASEGFSVPSSHSLLTPSITMVPLTDAPPSGYVPVLASALLHPPPVFSFRLLAADQSRMPSTWEGRLFLPSLQMGNQTGIGHLCRAAGAMNQRGAIGPNMSEYIAPGRADGECCVDETDKRVGLKEVATLGIRGGDEMLGQQSDMIGTVEHLTKDSSGLGDRSQPGERLGDPYGADDEGAFQLSKVVVVHVAVPPGVLVSTLKRQFAGDVQQRGFTERPVRVAQAFLRSAPGYEMPSAHNRRRIASGTDSPCCDLRPVARGGSSSMAPVPSKQWSFKA